MISKKTIILFSIGLSIIALFFIGKILFERNQGDKMEYITEEEYLSYSKLGIIYDGNESEIFDYLKENFEIDEFELLFERENFVTYKSISGNNYKLIESHLNDCKEITEILGTKETAFVNKVVVIS